MVGDRRILPGGWAAFSARPTPGAWVGYGAGFRTNRDDGFGPQRRLAWGMPADAFFASGLFGQNIVVVPSADLVVVRAGYARDGRENMEVVSRLVGEIVGTLNAAAVKALATAKPQTVRRQFGDHVGNR